MGKMKIAYDLAKSKKVGEECVCPSCKTKFIKKSYQQAFCKTKGGSVCKDKYWNTVTPTKRNNTTRISPANASWKSTQDALYAPNVVGGSGKVTGHTSEGYRIMDGIAYDEFDNPMYLVSEDDDNHPFDMNC